jgi:hypothetical protein
VGVGVDEPGRQDKAAEIDAQITARIYAVGHLVNVPTYHGDIRPPAG